MSPKNQNFLVRFGKPLGTLLGLILLFFFVQWVVKTYQKPGHMGVIESQAMDMAVQPPAGAMPVKTEIVQSQPFVGRVTYTGSAVAYNDVGIFPRVQGRIVALAAYPGDHVKAGQVLAQLDTQELSSKLQEAQASQKASSQQYLASLSQQGQASAQMRKAKDAIQAAKANLQYRQEEIRRSQALVKDSVITQEEAQKDESDFRASQSEYQQALAELQAAQEGAKASHFQSIAQRSQVTQARAAVQTQSIIRGYSRITAPQSGVITQRLVSPGTLVNPGTNILEMAQINPIRIQANVAESDVGRIRLGASVMVWNQKSAAKAPVLGKVSAIFPKTDLQSRTTLVEALIGNDKEQFLPGDFVSVSIQTAKESSSLSVPTAALVERNQQQAVWVVRNGSAHLQYVSTGEDNELRTAVIEGLHQGDEVIVQGQENLVEGSMVAQADYGPQGLKNLPKIVSTNRLSNSNHYEIKKTLDMYLTTISLQSKPPKAGNNTVLLTVVSGSGMSMPVNNIDLEVTNVMPAMAQMSVPKPEIQKMGEGRFMVKTDWIMGGLWKVEFLVKDGNQSIGVIPTEIEVTD